MARPPTVLQRESYRELRELLRSMNSYYSNRIEGQHTHPHQIDQALQQDFSKDAALVAKQRLTLAHISGLGRLRAGGVSGSGHFHADAAGLRGHEVAHQGLPSV